MNEELMIRLQKLKWPIIVFAVGILLMLLPGSGGKKADSTSPEERLAAVLSQSKDVGETKVLISDTGVVVACAGGGKAQVKMRVLEAVEAYTGFSSDKVTVLVLER